MTEDKTDQWQRYKESRARTAQLLQQVGYADGLSAALTLVEDMAQGAADPATKAAYYVMARALLQMLRDSLDKAINSGASLTAGMAPQDAGMARPSPGQPPA